MQPKDTNAPVPDDNSRGQVIPPARDYSKSHDAVANMTREQINQVYAQQTTNEQQANETAGTTQGNPYQRTLTDNPHERTTSDWQRYHSAWQDYYQKYYERYYVNAAHTTHQAYQAHAAKLEEEAKRTKEELASHDDEPMTQDEALYDLRSQLLTKVQDGAKKVRHSRHFIPLISAACVLLVFVFLQYNAIIFATVAAYTSPGNIDPANLIVNPDLSVKVGKEPRIIIPKLNIDIGVSYDAKPDYNSQMAAMASGTAYFGIAGANSLPGQRGNVPIAGHSSSEFYDTGKAKFIFARLDQLTKGDIFYLNYNGTRYTYSVTTKKVVAPNDVASLQIGADKPYATLITCTPVGTAQSRLLVFAEQISPDPSTAKPAPNADTGTQDVQMAGTSPTLLERAFGAR